MLTIQRAEMADAPAITKIKTEAFHKEINTYLGRNGGPPGYDDVASEEALIRDRIAYKILLDGEIIGAFFLLAFEPGKMRFEDFVITPEKQEKGYGYQTLQLVQDSYPNVRAWYLSTPVFSLGNQHLYEKFSYREIGRHGDEIEYCKVN
ncbi:MAG: hypothetical protein PHD32_00315 [Eubacteriales bacterium]|nr:hypothetical protein [Eubacteriales bacterium]